MRRAGGRDGMKTLDASVEATHCRTGQTLASTMQLPDLEASCPPPNALQDRVKITREVDCQGWKALRKSG